MMGNNKLEIFLRRELGIWVEIRSREANELLIALSEEYYMGWEKDDKPEKVVTFEMLEKVSEIFGTTNINIGALTQQDKYYPSTQPGSAAIIGVNDITIWP